MIVFLSISPPLFLVLGILATPPGPRIIPYYAISSDESTLSGFRVSKNTLSSDKARFGFSNSERTMSSSRRHYLRTSVRIFRQIQVYPGQRSVSTLRVRRTSTWTAELLGKDLFKTFCFPKSPDALCLQRLLRALLRSDYLPLRLCHYRLKRHASGSDD